MPVPASVADTRADRDATIQNVARAIGRSQTKRRVFEEVYRGHKRAKSIDDLMARTGFGRVKVLQAGAALAASGAFHQTKGKDRRTAYEKDTFVSHHKRAVLAYVDHPERSRPVATSSGSHATITVKVAAPPRNRVKLITVEDLDCFAKVRSVRRGLEHKRIPEAEFQRGMERIIGEPYSCPGWGGEKGDLQTTRVRVGGRRTSAAFAFKGPGLSGVLTPAKMGKRGDQILNLFHADAEVFLVQYWGPIGPEVLPTMHRYAAFNAAARGTTIRYGVIDGDDSARVIAAYPAAFRTRSERR